MTALVWGLLIGAVVWFGTSAVVAAVQVWLALRCHDRARSPERML